MVVAVEVVEVDEQEARPMATTERRGRRIFFIMVRKNVCESPRLVFRESKVHFKSLETLEDILGVGDMARKKDFLLCFCMQSYRLLRYRGGNLTVLVMDCNRWTMSGKKSGYAVEKNGQGGRYFCVTENRWRTRGGITPSSRARVREFCSVLPTLLHQ